MAIKNKLVSPVNKLSPKKQNQKNNIMSLDNIIKQDNIIQPDNKNNSIKHQDKKEEKMNNTIIKEQTTNPKLITQEYFLNNDKFNELMTEKTNNKPKQNHQNKDNDKKDIGNEIMNSIINSDNKYITRDLSWIEFNNRIIDMANDDSIPILERFKFLSISASNLDEFIMVRIGKLSDKKHLSDLNIMGESYKDEYKKLLGLVDSMINKQNILLNSLMKELSEKHKMKFIDSKKELNDKEKSFIKSYFKDKIQGLLTPLVFDNSRPFPLITSNSLYIGIIIDNGGEDVFGTIQVPNDLERVIEIKAPNDNNERHFMLLENIIIMCLDKIFINKNIDKTCVYRVLRNYDYVLDDNTVFLADEIQDKLKRRLANNVLRLDITGRKKEFAKVLHRALEIDKNCINKSSDIIDKTFGFSMQNIKLSDEEKKVMFYPPFKPQLGADVLDEFNIFDRIDKDDIILHHPYESYKTVVDFIKTAANDDNVVAIKQTLYRVSNNSEIMQALINAAEKGKQVTVLLEIKARFDEENNLHWASRLEKAGGHVIYGVPGLKTHCKMCLIVRRTKKGNLDKYIHIGTGNYNEKNAKIYEDISLLSSSSKLTSDVEKLFNYITGFSDPSMKLLLYSPVTLKSSIIDNINECIELAKTSNSIKINIKVNNLTDVDIINKLYEASENNVKINLIVRTSCSMYPINENITIKSIVGRFLEHSRIYNFDLGDKGNKVFIGSADLMERNMNDRIELLIPIIGKSSKKVLNMLKVYLKDDSSYKLINREYKKQNGNINSQYIFEDIAKENNKLENIDKIYSRFNITR